MSESVRYDILVIGSGPAGQKAAIQGAKAGKRVAIFEREQGVGGNCVFQGTIPSKTLRETALHLSRLKQSAAALDFQLRGGVEIASMMGQLDHVISAHAPFHLVGQPAILREIIKVRTECGIQLNWEETYGLMQEHQVAVGIMIADKWTLPDQVKGAIRHFSNYSAESSSSKFPMITCLADHLATNLFDPDAMDEQSLRDHTVVRDLNLYPENLDTLFEKRDMILEGSNAMAL